MSAISPSAAPVVLADALPGARVRDALLVVGGASAVGLASQASIPLWFTPIPLNLATFAVLLVGASLGWQRGLASMLLFVGAGVVGMPWFDGGMSGFGFSSFGYLIGYVVAAAVVGRIAASGADRNVWKTFALMAVGSVIVYAFGMPYLAWSMDLSLWQAFVAGVAPFLLGDLVKTLAASALLPGTWALLQRRQG